MITEALATINQALTTTTGALTASGPGVIAKAIVAITKTPPYVCMCICMYVHVYVSYLHAFM